MNASTEWRVAYGTDRLAHKLKELTDDGWLIFQIDQTTELVMGRWEWHWSIIARREAPK